MLNVIELLSSSAVDVDEMTQGQSCSQNGTFFSHGDHVPSENICTDCYCLKGEVVCATIDCPAPGDNCLPIMIEENNCCPTRYACSKFIGIDY